MKIRIFVTLFTTVLFLGCTPSPHPASKKLSKAVYEKDLQKIAKIAKEKYRTYSYEEKAAKLQSNSKLFLINIFPDDKKRMEIMFDYGVSMMRKKGICYYDKRIKKTTKCVIPTIVVTSPGEAAKIVFDDKVKDWSANELVNALYHFNDTYFKGFQVFRAEATLKSFRSLKFYNYYNDKEFYEDNKIDGLIEDYLKEKDIQLTNNIDDADYIVVYQSLAYRTYNYKGHLGKSLPLILNIKNIDIKDTNAKALRIYDTMGAITGMSYGYSFALGFHTYLTPTLGAFGFAGLFMPNPKITYGAAYEFLVIDNKEHKLNSYVIEKYHAFHYVYIDTELDKLAKEFVFGK